MSDLWFGVVLGASGMLLMWCAALAVVWYWIRRTFDYKVG
jgi:hypothetical protein